MFLAGWWWCSSTLSSSTVSNEECEDHKGDEEDACSSQDTGEDDGFGSHEE